MHGWLRKQQPTPLVRDSILLPRPQITVSKYTILTYFQAGGLRLGNVQRQGLVGPFIFFFVQPVLLCNQVSNRLKGHKKPRTTEGAIPRMAHYTTACTKKSSCCKLACNGRTCTVSCDPIMWQKENENSSSRPLLALTETTLTESPSQGATPKRGSPYPQLEGPHNFVDSRVPIPNSRGHKKFVGCVKSVAKIRRLKLVYQKTPKPCTKAPSSDQKTPGQKMLLKIRQSLPKNRFLPKKKTKPYPKKPHTLQKNPISYPKKPKPEGFVVKIGIHWGEVLVRKGARFFCKNWCQLGGCLVKKNGAGGFVVRLGTDWVFFG